MRFPRFVLALLLASLPALAATEGLPQALMSDLNRLQQAALTETYGYEQARHLCNNIGPRLSGSPQADHAARYVAEELRRIGLDARLEKVLVPHWVRGIETGELVQFVGQAPGTTQKVVLTALGGSVPTSPQGLTAEVCVVDSFDQLEALPKGRVEGKVVLFNEVFDKRLASQGYGEEAYGQAVVYRGRGAIAAARKGAVASLVRSVGGADYRLPHTGGMRYEAGVARIPSAAVAAEDAQQMADLAAQGPLKIHMILTPQTLPDVPGYNVVADLRGTVHPEEVVVVSGHLDSWDLGTGAIDDASGVAIAMETAFLIKKLNLSPLRTVRVVAWINEENGGAGSRGYVLAHAAELANHVAGIESDLGAGHPLGLLAHVGPAGMKQLESIRAILQQSGAGMLRSIEDAGGADISPMSETGVPTFGLIQDSRSYFNYHHTAADTFDKIVPQELAENCALASVLTYALASMPERLKRQAAAGIGP